MLVSWRNQYPWCFLWRHVVSEHIWHTHTLNLQHLKTYPGGRSKQYKSIFQRRGGVTLLSLCLVIIHWTGGEWIWVFAADESKGYRGSGVQVSWLWLSSDPRPPTPPRKPHFHPLLPLSKGSVPSWEEFPYNNHFMKIHAYPILLYFIISLFFPFFLLSHNPPQNKGTNKISNTPSTLTFSFLFNVIPCIGIIIFFSLSRHIVHQHIHTPTHTYILFHSIGKTKQKKSFL